MRHTTLRWTWARALCVIAAVVPVAALLAVCRKAQHPTLTLSIAASLQDAIVEVESSYQHDRGQVDFRNNFGASGTLAREIEQGAPVDAIISAGTKPIEDLKAKGLLIAGTRADLLRNSLVLIAPQDSKLAGFDDLAQPAVRLVAMGDPASVPAGQYGLETLNALQLYNKIQSKIVLGKDVRQVLTYVETGNVDAGLVYATDARISAKVRVVAVAPEPSHHPIVYPVAIVAGSPQSAGRPRFCGRILAAPRPGLFSSSTDLQWPNVTLPVDPSPLIISVATTCAATAATFFIGMLAAKMMYGMRGAVRAWVDGLLTLPLVLPPTVVGFFLLLIFGRRSWIGQALQHIGITVAFSWPATVIAATVVAFPLMYRTTLGAFEQVNPNLLAAARTLGAGEWRVFRRVLLPLAGPGVIAGTVLAFARALGEFGATLMLAGNIPGRTQTMPIAIFSAAESGDMRVAMIWVGLIVVLSLAIIRLLNYEKKTRPRLVERTEPANGLSKTQPKLVVLRNHSARRPGLTAGGSGAPAGELQSERTHGDGPRRIRFAGAFGIREIDDAAHDRRCHHPGSRAYHAQRPGPV